MAAAVAVMDAPSDRQGGHGTGDLRRTAQHAGDIGAVAGRACGARPTAGLARGHQHGDVSAAGGAIAAPGVDGRSSRRR